jgi:hypothetical protein
LGKPLGEMPVLKGRYYMRGLSMWFCFGKWANPQLSFGAPTLVRLCIGWFSFAVLSVDIDLLIGTLVRDITALKAVEAKRAHRPTGKLTA